jgi:hypothetical protein
MHKYSDERATIEALSLLDKMAYSGGVSCLYSTGSTRKRGLGWRMSIALALMCKRRHSRLSWRLDRGRLRWADAASPRGWVGSTRQRPPIARPRAAFLESGARQRRERRSVDSGGTNQEENASLKITTPHRESRRRILNPDAASAASAGRFRLRMAHCLFRCRARNQDGAS